MQQFRVSASLAEDQSLIPTSRVSLLQGTTCNSSSTGTSIRTNIDLHVYTELKVKLIFKVSTKQLTEINKALFHKPRQRILVHL